MAQSDEETEFTDISIENIISSPPALDFIHI